MDTVALAQLRFQEQICLIVYPKTENRNRKPVFGLSKTENPVLTAVPGFANPRSVMNMSHEQSLLSGLTAIYVASVLPSW